MTDYRQKVSGLEGEVGKWGPLTITTIWKVVRRLLPHTHMTSRHSQNWQITQGGSGGGAGDSLSYTVKAVQSHGARLRRETMPLTHSFAWRVVNAEDFKHLSAPESRTETVHESAPRCCLLSLTTGADGRQRRQEAGTQHAERQHVMPAPTVCRVRRWRGRNEGRLNPNTSYNLGASLDRDTGRARRKNMRGMTYMNCAARLHD